MKTHRFLLMIVGLALMSCSQSKNNSESMVPSEDIALFPERAKGMNIYEVNIRQYTPEGTINAFSSHLPRLESMGVDILWIMPVQPIGLVKRKGSLGSYYSIKDYTSINPEFGTMQDFKSLVNEAHQRGMLVILDWVANHTSWDHPWLEIDGYHTMDSLGNVISPVPDWSDVADLNFDNREMQDDMINALRFWVREADIDGYRCDMAGMVPMDFWNRAKDSLDIDKDLFMLAEWDEPKMHEHAFHMTYGWELHHLLNSISNQEKNVDSLIKHVEEDLLRYPDDAFRMNFLTNHDENSWKGSVIERLGEGHQAFAVLAFTIQGMPLLYSGQEAGLDRRLAFFEKDSIAWGEFRYQDFYAKLIELKHNNVALHNGAFGGKPTFIDTGNPMVIFYKRQKKDNQVAVLINLSNESQSVSLPEAFQFTDVFTDRVIDQTLIDVAPYQYFVGINDVK